jgi:hypothetical protein
VGGNVAGKLGAGTEVHGRAQRRRSGAQQDGFGADGGGSGVVATWGGAGAGSEASSSSAAVESCRTLIFILFR